MKSADESVPQPAPSERAELSPLESEQDARAIALMAAEKKAEDIVVLRVRELVQYTDWFVICSGRSDRQVAAIRDYLKRQTRNNLSLRHSSIEGDGTNQWVIIDYGDVVVHIFFDPVREYYQLEGLWADAPQLELDLPVVRKDPYSS